MSEHAFPMQAVAGLVLGFGVVTVGLNLPPHDATEELAAVARPDAPSKTILGLSPKRAANESRIFVVGASLTAGYPYSYEACYAEQLGAGLDAVFTDRKIVASSYAKPALDSPKLADMVEHLVARYDPSVICVTLGSNEFANRIFSGRNLVPQDAVEWTWEHSSRARKWFGWLAPAPAGEKQHELEKAMEHAVLASKPGKPFFHALPVPAEDQALLVERLRRSMRRMSAVCKRAKVPLVFTIACCALGGSWPWGISAGGQHAGTDQLVYALRRGADASLLGRCEALLALHPDRADLHYVHGELLRQAGRAVEAKRAFERSRDLDTVPMHLTSGVQGAIRAEAAALQHACLELDAPFAARAKDGIAGPEYYLDYGHLSLDGHGHAAAYLAEEFARLELIPALPGGWRARFADAARLRAGVAKPDLTGLAANIAASDGNFAMLFANHREAVMYLARAFRKQPGNTNLALKLVIAAFRVADRVDEVQRRDPQATSVLFGRLYAAMKQAIEQKRLQGWVDDVLSGVPLARLLGGA